MQHVGRQSHWITLSADVKCPYDMLNNKDNVGQMPKLAKIYYRGLYKEACVETCTHPWKAVSPRSICMTAACCCYTVIGHLSDFLCSMPPMDTDILSGIAQFCKHWRRQADIAKYTLDIITRDAIVVGWSKLVDGWLYSWQADNLSMSKGLMLR